LFIGDLDALDQGAQVIAEVAAGDAGRAPAGRPG
jgi:hypothetical protein